MTSIPTTTSANSSTKMLPTAIASKRVKRGVLGVSLHGWENAMVVFLIIAGLFALLAGAATWAVVRLQRIEIAETKTQFDKYKVDASAEIAKAQRDTELLRAKFSWRRIGDDKYSQLIAELRPLATVIGVSSFADPESASYADDIASALNNAGFNVRRQYSVSSPRYDLTLAWTAPSATALRVALRNADVPIEFGEAYCARPSMPDGKSSWDETLPLICVGLKPRPSP